MQGTNEMNRINYANTIHHRELIRKQIDPTTIENIEASNNPSRNYKDAFKGVYLDALERTVEELRQKHYKGINTLECSQVRSKKDSQHHHGQQSHSCSPHRPFQDFEEDKAMRRNKLVENQLVQGHTFFKAQDEYQRRKAQELEATNALIRLQMDQKQLQKQLKQQEKSKENYLIRQNRMRQLDAEASIQSYKKQEQQWLREDIQKQIDQERVRRHHKSFAQLNLKARHNPITNPIEYHIDNPYILRQFQAKPSEHHN